MNFSDDVNRNLLDRLIKMTQRISAVVDGYKSNKEMVKEIKVLLWTTELLTDEILKDLSQRIFTPQKDEKAFRNTQRIHCKAQAISALIYLN